MPVSVEDTSSKDEILRIDEKSVSSLSGDDQVMTKLQPKRALEDNATSSQSQKKPKIDLTTIETG